MIFASLSYYLGSTDSYFKEKSTIWLPKAKRVIDVSSEAFNYIERLKMQIIANTANVERDLSAGFKSRSEHWIEHFMIIENNAIKLFEVLNKYSSDILQDSQIKEQVDITFRSWPVSDCHDISGKKWKESIFYNMPAIAAICVLSKFQNDIRIIENNIVSFCHEKVGYVNFNLPKSKPYSN